MNNFKSENLYVCVDFNIDLMKYNSQLETTKFLDEVYSYGMYPLIVKPTRINDKHTTLIDDIFTNNLSN